MRQPGVRVLGVVMPRLSIVIVSRMSVMVVPHMSVVIVPRMSVMVVPLMSVVVVPRVSIMVVPHMAVVQAGLVVRVVVVGVVVVPVLSFGPQLQLLHQRGQAWCKPRAHYTRPPPAWHPAPSHGPKLIAWECP